MTLIRVSTETETWRTRAPDPTDSWDAGDVAGRVSNVAAWVQSGPYAHETTCSTSITVDLNAGAGDTIYAVVADYESGSTFGRDGGHACVVDAFAERWRAEKLAAMAMAGGSEDHSFTYGGKQYYRPWVGYFESLNALDVWTITVRASAQDNLITPPDERTYGQRSGH